MKTIVTKNDAKDLKFKVGDFVYVGANGPRFPGFSGTVVEVNRGYYVVKREPGSPGYAEFVAATGGDEGFSYPYNTFATQQEALSYVPKVDVEKPATRNMVEKYTPKYNVGDVVDLPDGEKGEIIDVTSPRVSSQRARAGYSPILYTVKGINGDWEDSFSEGSLTGSFAGESAKSVAKEELDNLEQLDAFSLLGQADKLEDESIIFYQNLKNLFPQWSTVLDDLINEEINHRGVLQALRESISPEIAQTLEQGETEAKGHIVEQGTIGDDSSAAFTDMLNAETAELAEMIGADTIARMNGDFEANDEWGEDSGTGIVFVESQKKMPGALSEEEEEINRLLG